MLKKVFALIALLAMMITVTGCQKNKLIVKQNDIITTKNSLENASNVTSNQLLNENTQTVQKASKSINNLNTEPKNELNIESNDGINNNSSLSSFNVLKKYIDYIKKEDIKSLAYELLEEGEIAEENIINYKKEIAKEIINKYKKEFDLDTISFTFKGTENVNKGTRIPLLVYKITGSKQGQLLEHEILTRDIDGVFIYIDDKWRPDNVNAADEQKEELLKNNFLIYQGEWYDPLMIYNPKSINNWSERAYKLDISFEKNSTNATIKLYVNEKPQSITCTAVFDNNEKGIVSLNNNSEGISGEIKLFKNSIYINAEKYQKNLISNICVRKEELDKIEKCMDIAAKCEGIENWRDEAYNADVSISYMGNDGGKYHIVVSERPSTRVLYSYSFEPITLEYTINQKY